MVPTVDWRIECLFWYIQSLLPVDLFFTKLCVTHSNEHGTLRVAQKRFSTKKKLIPFLYDSLCFARLLIFILFLSGGTKKWRLFTPPPHGNVMFAHLWHRTWYRSKKSLRNFCFVVAVVVGTLPIPFESIQLLHDGVCVHPCRFH